MIFRRKGNEIFLTGFDERERFEIRKILLPRLTKAEMREALSKFLSQRGFEVGEKDEIWIWS